MREFNSRLVQSIDFTEVITPQIKSRIKISGINVLDVERINIAGFLKLECVSETPRTVLNPQISGSLPQELCVIQ